MTRPRSLRIRGRDWPVRFRPQRELKGNLGLTHYDSGRLEVATRQSPFDSRDTLLHETLHAVLAGTNHGFPIETEEVFVGAIATGLLGVLHDNPELAQWLLSLPPHRT